MQHIIKREIESILNRYPIKRAALLPALWLVQEDEGWVSPEAAEEVAKMLDITSAEVREATSFYTMFSRKPIGRHHIQVCVGICCKLRGAGEILAHIKYSLGINIGQTTPDQNFHLSTVECLGSCGTAPMMQIDHDYYEGLTKEKVDQILSNLK